MAKRCTVERWKCNGRSWTRSRRISPYSTRNGNIIFINESWRRFLGRPKGSCAIRRDRDRTTSQYCELADHAFEGMGSQVAAGIRKVMQVGDAEPYSLTHPVHREEKSKWYRVTATSLGRSNVIGAVVMYQDVTEQHLAEEEIDEQAMLLDQAEEAIFVQDLQGRILYWNHYATRLHGWEAIEVRGRRAEDFLFTRTFVQLKKPGRFSFVAGLARRIEEARQRWQGIDSPNSLDARSLRAVA